MRFVRGKIILFICMPPIEISSISGYQSGSACEMACALSAALFWGVQLRFSFFMDRDWETQKEQRRPVSFFLLLPPIVTIVGGVLLLFPSVLRTVNDNYLAVCFPAILLICLILRLISLFGDVTLAGRLLRLTVVASMSAPLSLGITLILHLAQVEEAVALSSLFTIVLGALAFLIMANIMMVSYYGYIVTIDSINNIFHVHKCAIQRRYGYGPLHSP